jgi:hypothetical protein
MEATQSSSVFDSLEGRMDTIKEENKELDIVTALTTPLQQNVIKRHVDTLKRLKTQNKKFDNNNGR